MGGRSSKSNRNPIPAVPTIEQEVALAPPVPVISSADISSIRSSRRLPPIAEAYEDVRGNYRLNIPSRKRSPKLSICLDYIVLAIIFVPGVIFSWLPPPDREFRIDDPDISHFQGEPIISNALVGVANFALPVVLIILSYLFVGSIIDVHAALRGMLLSIIIAFTTTSFLWWAVGGLRPVFLMRCMPDVTKLREPTLDEPIVYYNRSICTGEFGGDTILATADEANVYNAMRGFPSGHASGALAAYGFLALYWNAKLKTDDKYSHFWKIIVLTGPLLFAGFVALSRIADYRHTPGQVIFGIILGIIIAPLAYRVHYRSVFGRYNHVPNDFGWYWNLTPLPVTRR